MWSRRNLQKLRACSWAERRLLLEALAWLGLMRLAVSLLPFRQIAARLGLAPGESPHTPEPEARLADRVGWAIRAMAARTPWPSTCLVQALAGAAMLRWRGLPGTLYLGAAKGPAQPDSLTAHAWLRCGASILTGGSEQPGFVVIATFHTTCLV